MSTMTSLEKPTKNVYQRRMEAKKLLAKEKFEESFSESQYKTVSIGEILSKVRSAHAKVDLIVQSGEFESFKTDTIQSNTGKTLYLYKAIIPFYWINPDMPEDRCEVKIHACVLGMQSDDKFLSKLYTSALKTLYRIEYDISGQSDADDIDMLGDVNAQISKPAKKAGEESKELLDKIASVKDEEESPSKIRVTIKKSGLEPVKKSKEQTESD